MIDAILLSNDSEKHGDGVVIIDNSKINDYDVQAYFDNATDKFTLLPTSLFVIELIMVHFFCEISDNIKMIYLSFPYESSELFSGLDVRIEHDDISQFILIIIRSYDLKEWKKSWSVTEFSEEFERMFLLKETKGKFLHGDRKIEEFRLIFTIEDINDRIDDEVARAIEEFCAIEAAAEASLTAKLTAGSVLTYFNFPEAVKVPCEQYLIYFAQFLRDIGIEATTEVTEQAGRVLFAVTPKDKDEALDTIREALDVYLHLPTAPGASNMADLMNADITIQRLSVNVSHLQNQFVLAKATIQTQLAQLQAKDATIEAKEARIQYLELSNLLTSGQVIIDSRVEPEISPEDERETVIEGILDVKRLDLWGAGDLNLPEIVRRLKAYVEQRKRKH